MNRPSEKGSAVPAVLIENQRVRVTRWSFDSRGANTGWHRHEFDYVVVPLFDGELEIEDADGGRSVAKMEHGVPYFRNAGVEHDVINANDFACAFVEVELLDSPKE